MKLIFFCGSESSSEQLQAGSVDSSLNFASSVSVILKGIFFSKRQIQL
jgi:hypothetical protein